MWYARDMGITLNSLCYRFGRAAANARDDFIQITENFRRENHFVNEILSCPMCACLSIRCHALLYLTHAFNQCISIILWVKIQFSAKQKENDYSDSVVFVYIHRHIVIIINLSFLFHFVCFIHFLFVFFVCFLSAVKIYKKKLNLRTFSQIELPG